MGGQNRGWGGWNKVATEMGMQKVWKGQIQQWRSEKTPPEAYPWVREQKSTTTPLQDAAVAISAALHHWGGGEQDWAAGY